jgi:tetratricopeptide (TPR) repeat protein/CHAT domain-containing protein
MIAETLMSKRRVLVCTLAWIALAALCLACPVAWTQNLAETDALNLQVLRLHQQGRYAEATELAQRVLAIREKALGPDHPDVGTSLNNLAHLYHVQGRYAEAEPLHKRALAVREKALGPDHPDVGQSLNNLARLYHARGRYAEAEPLYRRDLAIIEKALGPDHLDVGISLNNLGSLYSAQGRYTEAEPVLKRALAIRENALGPDHPNVGASLNNLAELYYAKGRYAEAEPLYTRALAIVEKAQGPDHPNVGICLNNLAQLYRAQGRYAEAEPLYRRALAITEKAHGPDHPAVGTNLSNLAALYEAQGRYAEAEPLHKRALTITENAQGPNHPNVSRNLNDLAALYATQGRYAEAEPLHKRALALREKALGPDHPDVGQSLNNLAHLYHVQGRYAEAEPLHKRAMTITEKAQGPDHPNVGRSLNNLAELYRAQGRYAESEPLYKRMLAIAEKALGPDHPWVGVTLNNLAELYRTQGRYAEAEPLYKRALTITEKAHGPDHSTVGISLNNLAELYFDQGGYAEAEPLYRSALAITEKALGPDHPWVGGILNNLAGIYRTQGRYTEAEPLYKRGLAIREKALGPDHPDVGASLNNLAVLHLVQRNWAGAADYWRRSTALSIRRAERGSADVGRAVTGKRKDEAEQLSYRFSGLIKAVHRLAVQDRAQQAALAAEMFQAVQWAFGSEAAGSLAQMAARSAKGDAPMATMVRERQDLVEEWQRRDGLRSAAVARAPAERGRAAEAANVARLDAIDARIAEVDRRLVTEFPEYAALVRPVPLSVEEAQAQLGAGEALIVFLDTSEWQPTPEETFVWVVTKTEARWVRSDLGTQLLTREVAALRCGLDAAAWENEGGQKCAELLKVAAPGDNAPLQFDLMRAHALYQALFGQVEDLIRDKHLLLVPSGPLTAFPFQALVTARAATVADYINAPWLIKRHATTVLPSVASLKSLRQFAKASKATRPFIGFGNPLLVGPDGTDKRAWAQQSCQGSAPLRVASRSVRGAMAKFFRSGLADVEVVRAQYPLPETADELCAVAKLAGSQQDTVYLGEKATETTIKGLSANGTLAQARIVHFATHGLLAGETEMLGVSRAEPALLLTPPAQASEEDDGLLTASEIAQLKLDADWVVLSACNTAASDKPGAEALSGLARAFFYAGARALLVSHWAVNSEATVKLITQAFDEIKADPKLGRAEAMRRSMVAMIGTDGLAHPSLWAPFVVVGEGAPAR